MFSYQAYGLGIHSALPLPGLVAAAAGRDVAVRLLPGDSAAAAAADPAWSLEMSGAVAVLSIGGIGVFQVRDGQTIEIAPAPGADARLLALYVLGNVMALLLHQRGLFVLHASAVAVAGGAVAFLGQPGWGKSSIAAALHARGHAVIADDVTPVRVARGAAAVLPGFPQLKLAADVVACLGCDPGWLRCLHPLEEKRGWRVAGSFPDIALPLRRLYVLEPGTTVGVAPIRPPDAIVELVRHSYPTRLLQPGGAGHFRQAAEIARTVPIYRLTRSAALATLPDLARLVEEHLAC